MTALARKTITEKRRFYRNISWLGTSLITVLISYTKRITTYIFNITIHSNSLLSCWVYKLYVCVFVFLPQKHLLTWVEWRFLVEDSVSQQPQKRQGLIFLGRCWGGDEFGCGMKNVKIIKSGDFSLKMLFQTLVLLSTNFEMLVGFQYI